MMGHGCVADGKNTKAAVLILCYEKSIHKSQPDMKRGTFV